MQSSIANRGRPVGNKRVQLSQWVSGNGEFTMGQLARSMNWKLTDANNNICRAVKAGEVLCVGERSVPGAKRPVAVYKQAGADVCAVPLANLVRVWR